MSISPPVRVSLHLRLLGLISAVFVVYIHATTLKYGTGMSWGAPVGRLQGLLSHNMLHVAVPIFFLNASFFLFAGLDGYRSLYVRMRRRGVSLLMPYLLWSALWLLAVLGLDHFLGVRLTELDGSLLKHLFVEPLPGQFWFLRDLIVLVAFSPLLLLLPYRALVTLSAVALSWWLFDQTPSVLSGRQEWYEVVSNEGLAWFLVGATAARKPEHTFRILERGAPSFALLLLAAAWLIGSFLPLPGQLAHGTSVVCGILLLMLAVNPLQAIARHPFAAFLGGYSFLIYLGHHPALGVLESWLVSLAPDSMAVHALAYVFTPLFVIMTIVLVFAALSRLAGPAVYALNGGRPLPPWRHAAHHRN